MPLSISSRRACTSCRILLFHGLILLPKYFTDSSGSISGTLSSPTLSGVENWFTMYVFLPLGLIKKAADFLTLSLMPVTSQNFLTFARFTFISSGDPVRRALSSAYARDSIRSIGLGPNLYPLFCFAISARSASIAILNSSGLRGSPCFTPLVIRIFLVDPFDVVNVVLASLYRSSNDLNEVIACAESS